MAPPSPRLLLLLLLLLPLLQLLSLASPADGVGAAPTCSDRDESCASDAAHSSEVTPKPHSLAFCGQLLRDVAPGIAGAGAEAAAPPSPPPRSPAAQGDLLDQCGETLGRWRHFAGSAEAHSRALQIRHAAVAKTAAASGPAASRAVADFASSVVLTATALMQAGRHAHALQVVQMMPQRLPRAALAIGLKLESEIHECAGDFVTALSRFNEAAHLEDDAAKSAEAYKAAGTGANDAAAAARVARTRTMLRKHELLQRVVGIGGGARAMPKSVVAAMQRDIHKLANILVRDGPWDSPLQMPLRFVPRVAARPFHRLQDWPALRPIHAMLVAAHAGLREEYLGLKARGEMAPDHECIMDPQREGGEWGGVWTRFDVTGNWNHRLDAASGCTDAQTPRACALLRGLANLTATLRIPNREGRGGQGEEGEEGDEEGRRSNIGDKHRRTTTGGGGASSTSRTGGSSSAWAAPPPVVRAGFSALGANTWLKPHFGTTNGQLKFHLGLIVPRGGTGGTGGTGERTGGKACATFRVGRKTRSWQEGKTIFFDDSFNHEAWNRCDTERVVFQLVVVHPDVVAQVKKVKKERIRKGTKKGKKRENRRRTLEKDEMETVVTTGRDEGGGVDSVIPV